MSRGELSENLTTPKHECDKIVAMDTGGGTWGVVAICDNLKAGSFATLHAEQIGVGACAVKIQDIALYAVSQQPIGQDVTLTEATVLPVEGMVSVPLWQRLWDAERVNNLLEKIQIIPSFIAEP